MSQEHSVVKRREAIERRVDSVLEPANQDGLTVARTIMDTFEDRWYGQLLIHSYESIAETPDTEMVRSAATAIELFRGYCRLRSKLLIQAADEPSRSVARNVTPALLAGDYLYSSAYSTLGEVTSPRLAECFDTLTRLSETIVEAYSFNFARSTPSTVSHTSFVDETAGLLGRGAATVGATLAEVDRSRHGRFATLGRGFSTDRQIRHLLDGDAVPGQTVPFPSAPDEDELRRHAERRRDEAVRALDSLSSFADTSPLRTLVGLSDDSHVG